MRNKEVVPMQLLAILLALVAGEFTEAGGEMDPNGILGDYTGAVDPNG